MGGDPDRQRVSDHGKRQAEAAVNPDGGSGQGKNWRRRVVCRSAHGFLARRSVSRVLSTTFAQWMEAGMKVSIGIGGAASGGRRDFEDQVAYVVEAEALGVDTVWTAEAWGQDAISPLAYLAAKTQRIRLGTGIMQISARTPSMTAMTALTMAAISNDRFILGLGASGPQVVEGLQGQPFKAPLTRMGETVDIIKLAFAGEKLAYEGKYHRLPLPGGEGKALRLARRATTAFPSIWRPSDRSPWNTPEKPPTAGSARRSPPSMRTPILATSGPAPKRQDAAWPTWTSRWAAPWRSAMTWPRWWRR